MTLLARTYIEATAVSPSALGDACADNARLFRWLFAGHDIKLSSAEAAAAWFDRNWPLHLPWPVGVRRRKPPLDPLGQPRDRAAKRKPKGGNHAQGDFCEDRDRGVRSTNALSHGGRHGEKPVVDVLLERLGK